MTFKYTCFHIATRRFFFIDKKTCSADFIGCGNFDVFGGNWTRNWLQLPCTLSSRPASITVTYCWLGHRSLHSTTHKLQRLLNAAACFLSGTKKFDPGLSQVMHVDLHWLDVPE